MATKGVSIPIQLDLDTSDIRKQGQALGNILERALNKNTRAKALDKLEKQIVQARDDMKIIQGAITRLMNTPVRTKIFDDAIKQAQEYKAKLKEAIDVWKNQNPKYAGMNNKSIIQALSGSGGTFGTRNVQTSLGFVNIPNTIKELQKAQKICDDLVKTGKAFEINQGAIDILKNELGESEEKVRELLLQMQQLSYSGGNSIQNAVQPLVNFNQEISQTIGSLRQAFGPYIQIATTAMSALVEVTKLEIKALAKVGETAIFAFKPLVSLAQGAAKAVGGIFDSIKKHNETTMKNLWRNVLRYGIGVRSMYFLIRKIRAVIGDVINELSKQIPEVNAKMSAFKTAVNGLKGALATAFQPILTAILPALTALINAVSKAIVVVGKFIALLTGQDFVYTATATQVDYAKSLEKTGKSAKKAKKELEGYLSPIDEINKYETKKDNDSGGGTDDGGGFTLKKVPIEDWIKDFWDKLKKMWETGDFYELGKMLGDKLAEMLANIPWDKIRANARKLGKSIATLLNGIMDGEFDGQKLSTLIGKTLAQAINTAFEFLLGFVQNFNWGRLGEFISEALIGVFDNLDWNLITEALIGLGTGLGTTLEKIFENRELFTKAGDALARSVNAMIYGAFAFLNQLDGYQIGMSISSFINAAIQRLDLNAFVQTCNKIMHLILDTLITAVQTTDWSGLGTKLVEAFNKIDFMGIFKKYSTLANSVVDAILDTIENFLKGLTPQKMQEVGFSIANFINQTDFQPARFGRIANSLLTALFNMVRETVQDIDWIKLGEDIKTFLEQIDWRGLISDAKAIWTQFQLGLKILLWSALEGFFGEIGVNCIKGFIDGLKSLTIAGTIKQILSCFEIVVNVIKKLFGIKSPSTVFFDIAGDIIAGFINGLKSIVNDVGEIWNNLKLSAENKFGEIQRAIEGFAKNIKTNVETFFTNMKNNITGENSILVKFKTSASTIFTNMKNAISGPNSIMSQMKKNVETFFTNMKGKLVSEGGIIPKLKTDASELFTKMKNKIVGDGDSSIVGKLKSGVSESFTKMKEKLVGGNGALTTLKTSAIKIFEDMWTAIKRVINSILGGIEKFANGIIKGFNAAIEAINNLAIDIPDWVPEVGGKTIGFSIPTISEITIPKLAQGAVIPPNKEFMAVLGDQKSGTNIETPLATMVEAFNQALRSSDVGGVKQINFLLPDRRTLAQYTIAGGRIIQTSTGKNPFELA